MRRSDRKARRKPGGEGSFRSGVFFAIMADWSDEIG